MKLLRRNALGREAKTAAFATGPKEHSEHRERVDVVVAALALAIFLAVVVVVLAALVGVAEDLVSLRDGLELLLRLHSLVVAAVHPFVRVALKGLLFVGLQKAR